MSEPSAVAVHHASELPTPFVVRGNVWFGIGAILVGPLLAAAPFLLFGGDSIQDLYPTIGGTALVMAGITLPWTRRCVIESDSVKSIGMFNITRRRFPIEGPSDLIFDGKKLRRRSDGKKLCRLDGIDCNPRDLRTLRTALPPSSDARLTTPG